ncbi:F0F1 ATP synthase subunit epsilon [Alloalcanivorax xenomutans]|jgi:F-type H+-transporting ATPase subunit epsilon|uniref:ATP synthase epsilon chain n=1 Tax=Alloalcanivorax xenomutans TaxID=1094342 RepID=A0A9Q3ZBB2_9GAMM|nr:F0F1 ATP synthase subunit epsilon [Alloalcanivorax xenomutans]ERS09424.1 F0F1 ATP synthase subunit epsilon [Alcanivorax sp. PN-3]KYZ85717.1 F0F1 ATP synthase subunit epsilon [Alcanivorax sp. KX64203]MBA4719720.1 F0F1 ATP synthase subunit epsilon [Alcanivorax sp.]ARB47674.1 ATP synthase F0F1 subunit epsilon [Alloalcanivorax xenomutans]MCE7507448.1 F0F1 ATP synthase subunit epsilon [Alloalcanivorax xenomutans]|tara:strand:+ start:599 stop:1024 length:426 start_codon:yes stop_codon:yes gene_type:complete|eukprot:gnl/TRDRNA2_/TRDRNA2_177851_c9_seq3.p2 gnl/TRDRNA2_/TRDRNA2_177851_c9~~gnl/TRDRNA2_/TRDRNA2_177851_c9_seq3.p2  ORF type:complete len:142 (-),score=33.10 gnl/TRDRNA2_/TRDRNA2_177851_c9_seq3:31-456(-)
MAMTVHCDIVSAEKQLFSGLVEMVVAAGVEGDLGVLPGHAPLLTRLKPGPVRVKLQNGEEEVFYVSGGFLEVQPKLVTVLADTAERAQDMDGAQAEQARQRAKEALEGKNSEMDYTRAAAVLAEASARLRTIEQIKKMAKR